MSMLIGKIKYFFVTIKMNYIASLQYKAWFYAYCFQLVFVTIIMYYLWYAIATSGSLDETLYSSPYELTTYIIMAGIINAMVDVQPDFIRDIRDGGFIVHLIKPYNIFIKETIETIGYFFQMLITLFLPAFTVAVLFLNLQFNLNALEFISFLVLLFTGMLVMITFGILFGLFSFLTTNIWGLMQIKGALITFLSGALVPLALFPDKLRTFVNFFPFRTAVNMPAEYFLAPSNEALVSTLQLQFIWMIINAILCVLLWKLVIRKRLVVNGG